MRKLFLFCVFLPLLSAAAGQRSGYVTGKLLDVRRYTTTPIRGHAVFCIAIQVEDISYLVDYEPFYGADHPPKELIVGDPIQIRIKGDSLWFIAGKRDPDKTRIIRRERISPDVVPPTCAVPVAATN